jgi:hypothetical protein
MGRPLKIQKYGTSQGITINTDGSINQPAAGVAVDQGYPNFGSLTDPVYYNELLTSNNFYGVVGGAKSSALSATYPIIKVRVYIANSYSEEADGVILRQKGSHKYMVATTASIDPENAVPGVALRITAVGDTDWTAMGLSGAAAVGTIFTPRAASGAGTSGTAQEVGTCILTSDLTPTTGLMSISYAVGGDSTEVAVSKLTNKFLQGWTGFTNEAGTSLTSYASTGDNLGTVDYSSETTYLANFFSDDTAAQATKSGAEAPTFANTTGDIELAQVEKYTS